jgi:predicted phage-related endonuclease
MSLTGFPVWDVAVLIGGSEFRVYTVHRSEELEREMVAEAVAWWERHIVRGEEPAMDGSEAAREHLLRMFPAPRKGLVEATSEVDALANALRLARIAQERAEDERARLENQLRALIGEREGFKGSEYTVTWKAMRGRSTVDWEGAVRSACVAAVNADGLEGSRAMEEVKRRMESVKAAYTRLGDPTRRFLAQFKGTED